MADLKISQLTSATLPLAGTEVLPIVQSSTTKKVATDDLTVKNVRSNATTGILQVAGPSAASTRTMTVPDANFTAARIDAAQSFTGDQTLSTGNLVIGTAGKGIDFSANSSAAGMTSELLNWYEEGTWTPAYATTGNPYTSVTYGIQSGTYTRIGRMVSIKLRIRTSAVTIGTASGALIITGLPFTSAGFASPVTIGYAADFSTNAPINAEVKGSDTTIALYYRATVGGSVASMQYNYLNTAATTNDLTIAGFYYV